MKTTRIFILVLGVLVLAACGPQGSNSAADAPPTQEQSEAASAESQDSAEAQESSAVESSSDSSGNSNAAREEPDLSSLEIGDGHISTEPRVGYVWSCMQNFNEDAGGAQATGAWFNEDANVWNFYEKPVVDGAESWDFEFDMHVTGNTRVIAANGLPFHVTGHYPVDSSDDAYDYDANPHEISEQSYTLELPANPTVLAEPTCVGGEVGIAISGVVINNALDAPGRDAVSTEIQDQCQGHPHTGGIYHYHSYSTCLEDQDGTGHSDLIGYVLDGFGLYGPYGENGEVLTNEDLDVCHGHTHSIEWDGEMVEMYHYHSTFEYPYTVGCFRGESVQFTDAIVATDQGSDSSQGNGQSGPPAGNGQDVPPTVAPPSNSGPGNG